MSQPTSFSRHCTVCRNPVRNTVAAKYSLDLWHWVDTVYCDLSEIGSLPTTPTTYFLWWQVVLSLRDKYRAFHEGSAPWTDGYSSSCDLNLPPWLCKPYERPPPDLTDAETEDGVVAKRPRSERRPGVSKREQKKLKKSLQREETSRRAVDICSVTGCPNPAVREP